VGRYVITIPPISIARQLWRFGEPDLASRAQHLSAQEAADIGERAGELVQSGQAQILWPDGPRDVSTRAVLLAAIEHIDGSPRPCSRARRLPARSLPAGLQANEDELWAASRDVSRIMTARLHGR
jgi:hypothetical protein